MAFWLSILILILPLQGLADSRGRVAIQGLAFLSDQPNPVGQYEGRLQLEYENSFKFSRALRLQLHPFIQVASETEAWDQPVFADPRELFAGLELKNFFAHAGFFTLVYEGTDGINPMDIASMKNWGDPLAPLNKASAGLHIGYIGNILELEAAYIPFQTASSLPGEASAWWPRRSRFPLRTETIELLLPDRVEYRIHDYQEIDHAFDHNYTARMQLRTDYGDAAAAFFEGASETPLIIPELDVVPVSVSPKEVYRLQLPVHLNPKNYRRRTGAGLITATLGEWIFRFASRYDQPLGQAKRLTSWSGQSVAGVERTFIVNETQLTFIVMRSFVQKPKSASLISIQDLFDRSILFGMRWPFAEAWTVQLSALRSGADRSTFYTGELNYTFLEQWSSKLLLQVLEGPPQSVLGIFAKNDRLTFELARSF